MTGIKGEKILGLYLSEEESNRTSCSFVNVAVKLPAPHSIKLNVNALEKYEWQWIRTLRTAMTLFGGDCKPKKYLPVDTSCTDISVLFPVQEVLPFSTH